MNDPRAFAHTGQSSSIWTTSRFDLPRDARLWITWIDDLIEDLKDRGAFATDERLANRSSGSSAKPRTCGRPGSVKARRARQFQVPSFKFHDKGL